MPTRRGFLAQSAAAGALAAAPALVRGQSSLETLDVAVIGGGIAGTFCAMRLKASGTARIALFESTDRIGGRLVSLHFPNLASQTAEIGGMRLRRFDEHVLKAIRDLIGAEDLQDFAYPTSEYFLRNVRFSSLSSPEDLPYGLDEREKAIIAGGEDLLTHTIEALGNKIAAGNGYITPTGFWELLLRERSKEGYDFARDKLGYNSPVSNWDAPTAIQWFERDFHINTNYLKLKGGLERVPHAFGRVYLENGGKIHLQNRLTEIMRSPDGQFDLLFRTRSGQRRVRTARVILALPAQAIQSLSKHIPADNPARFSEAIHSVHKVPLAKVHFSFSQDWWTPRNLSVGRLVTDLPARQIYRWGTDPETGHALLIASYHDGEMIDFWEALSDGPTFGPPNWMERARGPDGQPVAKSLQQSLPASERLVNEAWRQVRIAHGLGEGVPGPIAATYMNWGRDPWGAAYHLWGIGARPQETIDYLQEPAPGMHICNEAWAISQGWSNGSLQSADNLLENKFGLGAYVQA
ncbi:MAG: FAD-dependent oxidoreductase [Alphaproteobacteria bacterium]|nr:FAD-dependent oxidoreductase [Alphaproteobacteria bacterium]